ncbi:helix-turn-helix domain-containing protein [Pseudoduganella sp. FT25W]|uniref:Helix-turn-helix domain-containing protein n=1 Tax=Duganella alba TaxID=2666081 RepID=A0A6L5QCA9_9BURK|nr:AraC family transcriptional regulator [Duganella alba]MRX07355.1 helix-turn-helix domain-containing protein [Duganella alba]MRX19457.1 helix-turn-helix domain-containing protein [Duganella alba]
MEKQLKELRALAAHAENRRTETGIPRVAMVRGAIPEHQLAAVYDPMINLILQGGKSMTVGGRTLHYDPATYFVMSVGLPAAGAVHAAASGEPYLAVSLTLEPGRIANLLGDLPDTASRLGQEASAFSVAAVTPELLDAWLRMLRLMRQPADIPALAPVYEREILYRVLQGPMGWMLRDIAVPDSALARVNQAIQQIRRDYALPLRVDDLADSAAMSVSAFHRHFKSVTALSPLQYQKQIRLLNARTLLVAAGYSVTAAAHEVGYQSPTQFSREYAREFGQSPARDATRIVNAMR